MPKLSKDHSKQPLVSIIIPSYNHAPYVVDCVNSVLGQSYKNIELIVIDDGSEDGSVELLSDIRDHRFHLLVQDNIGAHATINKGLSIAKGDYLGILNSDDLYHPKRIEILVKKMQQNEAIGLICSWIQCIDGDGAKLAIKEGWKNLDPWPVSNPSLSYKNDRSFALHLLMSNFISTTSNMMFSRKVYETVGGMRNLRFAHDWDFALRVAKDFECEIIESPLISYRLHGNNTINKNRKHMLFEIVWIYLVHIRSFLDEVFNYDDEITAVTKLLESINLQGNDHLFWALSFYIEFSRKKSKPNPEDIFINDPNVRESFFQYIKE